MSKQIADSRCEATNHPTASPDGAHIASVNGARLLIRSLKTLDIIRNIGLPPDFSSKKIWLRWSRVSQEGHDSNRVLLADEDNARVWDLRDPKWTAVINNGTGGMGKIATATFGRTEDEVILTSDFGTKVTVWSVASGRSVEIKDPKFPTKGFAYSPRTGLFTILSRPGPQDIITLHAPSTYSVINTILLASSDAQGFKWSPDGRWLVVWDTPSCGTKTCIYTADGHLYRVYTGDGGEDDIHLGVKSVEWSRDGGFLAVGGHDSRVVLLNTRTVVYPTWSSLNAGS